MRKSEGQKAKKDWGTGSVPVLLFLTVHPASLHSASPGNKTNKSLNPKEQKTKEKEKEKKEKEKDKEVCFVWLYSTIFFFFVKYPGSKKIIKKERFFCNLAVNQPGGKKDKFCSEQ